MRIKKTKENLDYQNTRDFFRKRAQKYREDNPYSVTMYQDNNESIVRARNQKEIDKLKPLLRLNSMSRVLDVACGIGRWADAIDENVSEYCGIDFSAELISIARKRNHKQNYVFYEGSVIELEKVLEEHDRGTYNVVLMMGIFMYINDADMVNAVKQVIERCTPDATVCIREPIGVSERLTLKDFFSEELGDTYNAIYRTRKEFTDCFKETFLKCGFVIEREGAMFEEKGLNNRKETEQYFYILRRNFGV